MMEGDDAEGHAGDGDGGEAGVEDFGGDAGVRGELVDGAGEVFVGGAVAGDEGGEAGEDFLEVEIIEGAEEAGGLGEFEDVEVPAGVEGAVEVGEGGGAVGEVAETEGNGDGVGGDEGEGLGGVGLLEGDGVVARGEFFLSGDCLVEHGLAEIEAEDFCVREFFVESEGEVTAAGGEVEKGGGGLFAYERDEAFAPVDVDAA